MSDKNSELDSFDIIKTGSLADDIQNVDIKLTAVPKIEVKEVVIKETGNFLNVKDNIINIPVEMIVFPFFTPQKQNKKVNFQYSFQDLGVTMSCTLIAKDIADKVFQPSIFEEKIYTYLISMYELKKDLGNTDDYIEFEISDFIVNFLGNKMNRTYYTKVEQALKNMKNTEYQFVVSNHTKLGNYKFEDEEFKLLTYQKLERGRKKYYRVTLNKNIRQKIKDKRYIKYNSKSLLEILTKDPIAGRIYKYISKIRYDKEIDSKNLRTLAAIIPLKTEQITERVNKSGEIKKYVLCRLKQVLKRVCKAFDVLSELGYILEYSALYNKKEDTYFINYKFNLEKDGECHVSSYLENKNSDKSIKYNYQNKNSHIDEAEIIEINKDEKEEIKKESRNEIKNKVSKLKKNSTSNEFKFPDEVMDKIIKAKRNIYVSRAWDKRTDTKIKKIFIEEGEEKTKEILNILYKNLTENIKTTLVQYINGILKNLSKDEKNSNKQNLTLFGNVIKGKGLKRKKNINRARKGSKRTILHNISEIIDDKILTRDILEEFESYDEYEKLKIEEKALKICAEENGADINFLLFMKDEARKLYIDSLKPFIERVIREMKNIK